MAETAKDLKTLEGGCHCGAVRFKASNLDLSKLTKCNCSICIMDGTITTKIPGSALSVANSEGQYVPFTYEANLADNKAATAANFPNLSMYQFESSIKNPNPDMMIFRHFCGKCGVPVFATAYAKAFGGAVGSVNITTLKLKDAGFNLKDMTRPEKMGYIDAAGPEWNTQIGEPWPHGCW